MGIYGSSRLGLWRPMRDVESTDWWLQSQEAMNGTDGISTRSWTRGAMNFELSNHLGNVLVTVSDRRIQVQDNGSLLNPKPVLRFDPDVLTANDYYPFGMGMPGRKFEAGSLYRYGFNGQERSTEVDPKGNSSTAEFWQYDARLGRRLNIDPVVKEYESPYLCYSGSPIVLSDPNGDDAGDRARKRVAQLNAKYQDRRGSFSWSNDEDSNIRITGSYYIGDLLVNHGEETIERTWLGRHLNKAGRVIDEITDYVPVVSGVKSFINHAAKGEWGQAALSLGGAILDGVLLVGTGGTGNLAKMGIKAATRTLIKRVGAETIENYVMQKTGVPMSLLRNSLQNLRKQHGVLKVVDGDDAGKSVSKLAKKSRKMSTDEIEKFLDSGVDWHKTSAKKDFLKGFRKELKGDLNADFWVDKTTKEVFLKSNKSSNWIPTGLKFE